MLIGVLVVLWLDGFAKLLTQTLPLLQVVWWHFAVQFIIMLPLALHRHGRQEFHIRQWRLRVLRGSMLVLASIYFFATLRTLTVANAIAIFLIHPLLSVVCAPVLLKKMLYGDAGLQ